jgi:hypothetical protein
MYIEWIDYLPYNTVESLYYDDIVKKPAIMRNINTNIENNINIIMLYGLR